MLTMVRESTASTTIVASQLRGGGGVGGREKVDIYGILKPDLEQVFQ